ncbi:hypothetical protein [Streptomyces sp. NPDC097610]|uniref:hypothetical protein n=1 Tax=Streptomyces sp. NPDC097610 TaxID=3157227 RepID=UPI0033285DE9
MSARNTKVAVAKLAWHGRERLVLPRVKDGAPIAHVLQWDRDPRRCLTATATAALLVVDAWFDVTTSQPGPELATAVVMAVCAELPMGRPVHRTGRARTAVPHPRQGT